VSSLRHLHRRSSANANYEATWRNPWFLDLVLATYLAGAMTQLLYDPRNRPYHQKLGSRILDWLGAPLPSRGT
jgi:hypothetical protein